MNENSFLHSNKDFFRVAYLNRALQDQYLDPCAKVLLLSSQRFSDFDQL